MGELIKQVSKECDEQIRTQLRRLGSVFLNHREVSAQEAVYRILSLPLKQLSRKVVFINTATKEDRVSLLKHIRQIEGMEDNSEDILITTGMLLDQIALLTCAWPSLQPTTPPKVGENSKMGKLAMHYPHLKMKMKTAGLVNALYSRMVLHTCTSIEEKLSFAFTGSTMRRKRARFIDPN